MGDGHIWALRTDHRILVGSRGYGQMTLLVQNKPSPSRSLNCSSGRIKLFFHVVQGAKIAVDGVSKGTRLEDTSTASTVLCTVCGGSKVLPEERVVDVT